MPLLSLAEAEELVVRTLTRVFTSAENASSVARALVAAEADGLKGHGLTRLPSYAAQAKVGKVDGTAKPSLTRARPGLLVIDAANGFAFPALDLAIAALSEVVRGLLQGRPCSTPESFYRLRSAGLALGDSARDARLRCQLYATYLEKHLL